MDVALIKLQNYPKEKGVLPAVRSWQRALLAIFFLERLIFIFFLRPIGTQHLGCNLAL